MQRLLLYIQRFFGWLLFATCLLVSREVFAVTVDDIYDLPTSTVVSANANHKFVMTIASGVDEGDTLTVSFPTSFDTSLITEDDVDIADDGVELTTAANCSGSEQASVAIATDMLTVTVCAGDGGGIAAGSVVAIRIGTNAVSSGTGSDRIGNPSIAATYLVTIGGTFGDTGSVPLVIVASDSAGVSGSVPEAPSSGGGGSSDPDPADPVVPTVPVTPDVPPVTPPTDPETPTDTTTDTSGGDTSGSSDVPTSSGGSGAVGSEITSPSTGGTSTTELPPDVATPSEEVPIDPGVVVNPATRSVATDVITVGGLQLSPKADTFAVLADSVTSVYVVVDATLEVISVVARVNDDEYALQPEVNGYSADIVIPSSDAYLAVEITYSDGTIDRQRYFFDVRSNGLVYETVAGVRVPVVGATITVYQIQSGSRVLWNADAYGDSNPVIVGSQGVYSWYVPNGTYIVRATKEGYVTGESSQVTVRDHLLALPIELTRMETDVAVPQPDETTIVTDIRELPAVQTAVRIAVPVTAALAVTTVTVLASSFSLLPFLQYLFTSPVLFFARRKRRAFGVVYNAATKLPIDLAIIRVFAMPERRLVRSVVTDQQGKYLLTIDPGTYRLQVVKQNFVFPGVIVQGKEDGQYLDVYAGQDIVVTERDATIAVNIPLDPIDVPAPELLRVARNKNLLRRLQNGVALFGTLLSLVVAIITPSVFAVVMCGVQVLAYMFVRRLTHVRKPKGWGIVYSKDSGQPVGNAIVRLFEPTYNKLIETVVTDRFGRYAFLVGPSEYYVVYSKQGFVDATIKPIDYRTLHEPTALALDVSMEKSQ